MRFKRQIAHSLGSTNGQLKQQFLKDLIVLWEVSNGRAHSMKLKQIHLTSMDQTIDRFFAV